MLSTKVIAQQTSLSISPPLIEAIIKPGKSILIAYTIYNNGDPVILKPYIASFETTAEGKMIIKDAQSPIRFSLDNSDISLDQPFFLKTGERQQLLVRMRIPEGAAEGDYYHSLLVESQPPPMIEGMSSSRNKATIGANILMTVTETGNLNLDGKVILFDLIPRFKTNFFGKTLNIFDSSDKIPLVFVLKNNGKNMFSPQGEISLKGNFGEQAKYDIVPANILTNSQRLITATPSAELKIKRPVSLVISGFFLGYYQLSANIRLGVNTRLLSANTSFIAFPFKFVMALISIIIIAVLIIKKTKKEEE